MATAFYNRFDDYIFAAPTDQIEDGLPVARVTQAGAEFYGLETEATVHLLEEEFDHLELRLAADYVRGKLRDGSNLPQMPPLRFGAELQPNGCSICGVRNFWMRRRGGTALCSRSSCRCLAVRWWRACVQDSESMCRSGGAIGLTAPARQPPARADGGGGRL